jgi:uncharacterized protein with beta-barrel porin domain
MCCAPGQSRAKGTRRQRRASSAIGFLFVLTIAVAAVSCAARAASVALAPPATPAPAPAPTPSPSRTGIDFDLSVGATLTNLGSNFLERLGNQATSGLGYAFRNNPGGGGGSEATDGPHYRAWGEAYGISTRTGAQLDFVGDRRQTWGGVAGVGATFGLGVNLSVSVDQSRTAIDVPLALQSATLDLTQFGFNASIDKGPWTWAIALVHGFGNVNSSRDTGFGVANAGYNGRIDGALTELSYYLNIDQSRLVPKAALEYVRASTGSFHEQGGFAPLTASGASAERSRILLGAEVGRYWILDQKVLDLSAYGKLVDNVSQNFSSVTVSLGNQSITVQGIGESRYGANAGASASLSLSNRSRLYLNYDGKFRTALQSHQGTLGLEFKW